MSLAAKRNKLILQLKEIHSERLLDEIQKQLEAVLMRERIELSEKEITTGKTISLQEFSRSSAEWIQKKSTK